MKVIEYKTNNDVVHGHTMTLRLDGTYEEMQELIAYIEKEKANVMMMSTPNGHNWFKNKDVEIHGLYACVVPVSPSVSVQAPTYVAPTKVTPLECKCVELFTSIDRSECPIHKEK